MKLVKFTNGKYAIRRGWLFKQYRDFRSYSVCWWSQRSNYFRDCLTDYDTAVGIYELLTMKAVKVEPRKLNDS